MSVPSSISVPVQPKKLVWTEERKYTAWQNELNCIVPSRATDTSFVTPKIRPLSTKMKIQAHTFVADTFCRGVMFYVNLDYATTMTTSLCILQDQKAINGIESLARKYGDRLTTHTRSPWCDKSVILMIQHCPKFSDHRYKTTNSLKFRSPFTVIFISHTQLLFASTGESGH